MRMEEYIIYEDRDILICHKRPGIPVQSAKFGVMDMECGLKNYLAEKEPDKVPYLGVIQRLDQPVEGLLVFAKTSQAAKELNRQLNQGCIGKYYLAVTSGKVSQEKGKLENYLKKDGKKNMSFVVEKTVAGAKKAVLEYELLESIAEKNLLRIRLETGRHHQIRVQMSCAGMPLMGDRKYNTIEDNEGDLGLCSYKITLIHPRTRKKMCFKIWPSGSAFAEFTKNKE